MEPSALHRDAKRVQAALQELPDGRVVAREEVKIYVPVRFIDRGLAYVGLENHILGVYLITVADQVYGVSLINAMIKIEPSETNKVKMAGDEFLEFIFREGSTVFKSLDLVMTDTIVYYIYDEMLAKGNIPWYLDYDDLSHLFDTAKKHANANIGQQQEVTQLIISLMGRSPEDRTRPWRNEVRSHEDPRKPVFVPLMSVRYTATNTLSKLAGSYFGQGVISALIHPAQRTERIENLLRK